MTLNTPVIKTTNLSYDDLCNLITENLESLLTYFEFTDWELRNKEYRGACPLHGGDNKTAWFYGCRRDICYWRCCTRQCEKDYNATPVGLIEGLLAKKYGYKGRPGTTQVVKFLSKFLNQELGLEQISIEAAEKINFNRIVNIFTDEDKEPESKMTREYVRKNLKEIPAPYYIKRNYKAETLDKFDVGVCSTVGKEMCGRAVIPVYNSSGFFVGCTGRTLVDSEFKWKHSWDLNTFSILYNLNNAKEHIAKTGYVILVESPGNVWRLWQCGIYNVVGTFGAKLSDGQKTLLDYSGATGIIAMFDPDDAGRKATDRVVELCKNAYNVYIPTINALCDIGDMVDDRVIKEVKPVINNIIKNGEL